eukprot:jgi/Botrbrau1/5570/Bobra.97_2s0001.1
MADDYDYDDPMEEDLEFDRSGPSIPLASLRFGPFVSATKHVWLTAGQPPESGVNFPEENILGQSTPIGGKRRGSANQGSAKRGKTRGASSKGLKSRAVLTLKDLLDHGIITPGHEKISVVYKGNTYKAALTKEGKIMYQGIGFTSATAFSIHCKRQQTPNKQGDDGWKSVHYEGQALDFFRRTYYSLTNPEEGEELGFLPAQEAEDPEAAAGAGTAEAAAAGGTEAVDTDHWVQCDRCRSWRIVPDQSWPSVEADTRDVWFCEDADWDLSKYQPFTGPCPKAGGQ